MFSHRFDFQLEDVSSVNEETLPTTGLPCKYTAQWFKPKYKFFHDSSQEYLAGCRVGNSLKSQEPEEVTKGNVTCGKWFSFQTLHPSIATCFRIPGSATEATGTVLKDCRSVSRWQPPRASGSPTLRSLSGGKNLCKCEKHHHARNSESHKH